VGIEGIGFDNNVELEEYVKLANEFALDGTAIQDLKLEKFFRDNMIGVYDLDKVSDYLESKAPSGKVWCWKPLRREDKEKDWCIRGTGYDKHGYLSNRIYGKPIPYPVLATANKVAKEFGDKVAFYVSDYEDLRPDPFLMVTSLHSSLYVVEKWDEPSFRG
jgi:hypothetical protein